MFFHTKFVPEPRWSTSAVRRVRDGLVCGRVMVGYGRIMVGSWSDRFRIVNGVSTVFRACVVDRIPLWFATVGSFPHCKWGCKWCWWMSCRWNSIVICNSRIVPSLQMGLQSGAGGGVADGVVKEISHEMRFWEIADARKPMFFHTKFVPEPRWSTSAVRRVRDGLVCGRIMVGYARIMVGSVPHCKWGFNCFSCMCGRQNSIVICTCRIVPAL